MRISDWSSDVCSSDLLVPLVEALKMPIVPIGVGAQAATYRRIQLPAGTKRFLAAVADRCHSVGVRGHYSAEALHDAGIKNVPVIGRSEARRVGKECGCTCRCRWSPYH